MGKIDFDKLVGSLAKCLLCYGDATDARCAELALQEQGLTIVDGEIVSLEEKKEQDEQTSAWSNEDEVNLSRAIWYVENPALSTVKDTMLVEWLKSLKDRVQPKPQQEWSEEDEKEVAVLEAYIRSKDWSERHIDRALGIVDELVKKLKILKDRYAWRPSDEQMKLLSEVQQALLGKDCHNRFVNFMYELKRLREE